MMFQLEQLLGKLASYEYFTVQHIFGVQRYCINLGAKLGMCGDELMELSTAALMHDIGKLFVPRQVLVKQGGLTKAERDLINLHSVTGAQVLQEIGESKTLVDAVRHHHERYDGMGYPDGLQGQDIPLFARIINIADSFDAMVGFRTYRDPKVVAEAFEELKRCSGTHFDPDLVKAFIGGGCIERIHPCCLTCGCTMHEQSNYDAEREVPHLNLI